MLLADAPVMNWGSHRPMTAKRNNPKQDASLALLLAVVALLLTVGLRQVTPGAPGYAVRIGQPLCAQSVPCPAIKDRRE